MFKVKMLESTLRNLTIAMGLEPATQIGSAGTYDRVIFGGETDDVYVDLLYTVEQQADTSLDWLFQAYRARASSGLVLPFNKGEERAFEVEFKLYPQTTEPYALGEIKKEVTR